MAKTKEEILIKGAVYLSEHEATGIREDVLTAMDEYAQQEAIGFAKYLDDLKINADKHFNTPKSATTVELYFIYLKSKT